MTKTKRIVDLPLLESIRKNSRCVVCGDRYPDPHHVKSKKSGGDDVQENLMPLCRLHHTEVHKIGLNKFTDKYTKARNWLLSNDYEINDILMRWIRPKKGGYIP